MVMKSLYEKYCDGDKLTDREIQDGVVQFNAADAALAKLGPCFVIPRKECRRMHDTFLAIANARVLNKRAA